MPIRRFKDLIYTIYTRLLVLGDFLVIRMIRPGKATSPEKVLLVRTDRIGDFVLWLDSAKEFRRLYPADKFHITLLANSLWAGLADPLPHWDRVLAVDTRRFRWSPFYRWFRLAAIRREGFSVVHYPVFSRKLLTGDIFVYASAASQRVGFNGDLANMTAKEKLRTDRWYTQLIDPPGPHSMELERNADFMRQIGAASFQSGMPKLPVLPASGRLAPPKPYYLIAPGASEAGKQWPAGRFAKLCRSIYAKTKWNGVMTGEPSQQGRAHNIRRIAADARLDDLTGKTGIRELAALVAGAELVISNDSAAVHMAAATGVPSVCLTGGGHPGRFLPYAMERRDNPFAEPVVLSRPMPCYGCGWHCIYPVPENKAYPCLQEISLEQVWEKVENLLDEIMAKKREGP